MLNAAVSIHCTFIHIWLGDLPFIFKQKFGFLIPRVGLSAVFVTTPSVTMTSEFDAVHWGLNFSFNIMCVNTSTIKT